MQITQIEVSKIFADPTFNCRGSIAPIDVTDLAKDIDDHGLQQPIVVKPLIEPYRDYTYKVVSGHRRHKAFQVLNKETIPCIINESITDSEALILNLGENIHRQDLNIIQEATALNRLKLEGFSVIEVAEALNKSTTWVQVRYMLLELPEPIKEAAAAGFITQRHIRDIHKLGEKDRQLEAARKIKDAKIRGEKSPAIKKYTAKRNILKAKARDRDDIFWMQNHIQESIGNNLGTRCLAWAAGEINDFDLFQNIEELAITENKKYLIPYELGVKSG